MNWRNDKITDGQAKAIRSMGWTGAIPGTKGEACDLIAKIKQKNGGRCWQ